MDYGIVITNKLDFIKAQRWVTKHFGYKRKLKCQRITLGMNVFSEDEVIFSCAISKFQHLLVF